MDARLISAAIATTRRDWPIDVDAVIARRAALRPLVPLPSLLRATLGAGVRVLVDRGPGMAPFARDAESVVEAVRRVAGDDRTEVVRFWDTPLAGGVLPSRTAPLPPPPHGRPVLVLTDLGIAPAGPTEHDPVAAWLAFADAHRDAGAPVVVLVPYPPARWPAPLARALTLVPWDRTTSLATVRAARRGRHGEPAVEAIALLAERNPDAVALARLASLAAQIEPELLRALRLGLLRVADVSAEADLWWSEPVEARSAAAIRLAPDAQAALRAELAADRGALDAAYRILAEVRAGAPPMARLQERLVRAALVGDAGETETLLRQVLGSLLAADAAGRASLAAWAITALPRLPPSAHGGAFWSLLYAANAQGRGAGAVGAAPTSAALADAWAAIPAVVTSAPRVGVEAVLRGDALWLRAGNGDIEVPDIEPIVVEVEAGDTRAIARVSRTEWTRVGIAGAPIRITALDRRVFTLVPAAPVETIDWRAIAAIRVAGATRGTGYLIDRRRVVTARSAVAETIAVEVEIDGGVHGAALVAAAATDRSPLAALVVTGDDDAAVLALDVDVNGIAPIVIGEASVSPGRLRVLATGGLVFTGHYTARGEIVLDVDPSREVPLLGAPVFAGDRLVGHVAQDGTLCSASAVRALLHTATGPTHELSRLALAAGRGIHADEAAADVASRLSRRGLFALVGGTAAGRRRLLHRWLATLAPDQRALGWSFLGTQETRARRFAVACARHFDLPPPSPQLDADGFAAIGAAIAERDGVVVLDGPERCADHDRPVLDAFTRAFASSERGRCVLATPERRDKATTLIPIGALPRVEALRHALAVGLYPAQPDDLGIDVTVDAAVIATLEAAVQRGGSGAYSEVRATLGAAARWLQAPDDPSLDSELFGAAGRARSEGRVGAALVAEAAARDSHELAARAIETAIADAGRPPVIRALRRELLGDFVEEIWFVRTREPARRVQPRLASLLASPSGLQRRIEVAPEIGAHISVVRTAPGQMSSILDRWRAGDPALEALIEWIAEDAPAERPDDPLKGRFGALPERNGRRVTAHVGPPGESSLGADRYQIRVDVAATGEHPLVGTIVLHTSWGRPDPAMYPVEAGTATIRIAVAKPCTIGIETDDGATRLELDLALLPGLPPGFLRSR